MESEPMNPTLKQRLEQVAKAMETAQVDLAGFQHQKLAQEICDTFDVLYGSLIRTAQAIRLVDGAERLEREHLQEAAQHLILKDDPDTKYSR